MGEQSLLCDILGTSMVFCHCCIANDGLVSTSQPCKNTGRLQLLCCCITLVALTLAGCWPAASMQVERYFTPLTPACQHKWRKEI